VLGIALFTVAAAAVFVYFLRLSGVDLLPRATYTLHGEVPDIVAMSSHADVLEAGVRVGDVDGVTVAGDHAALTLSLDQRYGPVYRDGQLRIRAKTLAGENYVDLYRGDPRTGAIPAGGTLATRAPEATQLDQIISALDAPHRRDMQRILDVLGAGLGGHGAELGGFLGGTADLVDSAAPVGSVLAADRERLASLIDDFGQVSGALGARAGDIRRFVTAARGAASAVGARAAQVRATFRELPGFLAQARSAVAHLSEFSVAATPVIRDLRLGSVALIPAVRTLGPQPSRPMRSCERSVRSPASPPRRPPRSAASRRTRRPSPPRSRWCYGR
jgi:virulence factor Mce-like protein